MDSGIADAALVYALGIAVLNGLIHGYTGFGGALLMVPLLSVLYNPVEAIAMVGIATIFGSAQLYPAVARHAVWRELLPVFAGLVVFVPLGAYLLFHLDPQLVRRSMGGFILLFAVILMSGWIYRGPRGVVPSALVGALAGGITGASGVGGPPIALYYLASPHPTEIQRANIVISVAVMTVTVLTSVAVAGGFSIDVVLRGLFLTPAYLIGVWSGARLFIAVPKSYFRYAALWLLMTTGIAVLVY
ncbi:sulfite exporter TauE/SafE family protein [Alphaproteobacteria bacterium]|nr:sulfite exporter TauE/SafE family protein [Alphaproteobacteria bacterium]